ncbi:leucine-rich repeat transmembrane neuronal protein 2-like [Anopheles aquasalis]|uniref:leucine-rich repeat transmembrane neuronal protein 2-like n=1 Tax=Anopheles aquasalis TaxID=42839 RepID=UPI00215A65FC|nr:leucine-rich repeat transmembrane neuronal protein 2-like [Anopheles aquasalis]
MSRFGGAVVSVLLYILFCIRLNASANDLTAATSSPKSATCYHAGFAVIYECILKNVHIGETEAITVDYFTDHKRAHDVSHLTFENSTISRLPKALLSAYPKVRVITLKNLQIKSLERGAFDQGGQVKMVDLSSNAIAHLDPDAFNGLPLLRLLSLNENNLTHLPVGLFSSNKRLVSLTMISNHIGRIEDNTFTYSPQHVDFYNNSIEHFDLDQIAQATSIDVSCNRLTEVKISVQVEALVASKNRITRILPRGENKNLKLLLLSHNKLRNISWISMFPELETLDLAYNEIETIVPEYFPPQTKLEKLLLNNNRLMIFDLTTVSLEQLHVLDLSHNLLSSVERNSALFDRLGKLYLHSNGLKTLMLSANNNIQEIQLANNDWDCANLRHLLQVINASAISRRDEACKPDYINVSELCCKEHAA